MKHLINIISIFAVLLLSSCGKNEEEALREFKKEMESLEVVIQQVSAVDMEDGPAVIKAINRFVSKLEPIETRGLPEDLKKAFEEARESWTEMAEYMSDTPFPLELADDEEALGEWVLAQVEKDPEFLAKFEANGEKYEKGIDTLGEDAETAALDLEVAFKKHKIDVDLSELTP